MDSCKGFEVMGINVTLFKYCVSLTVEGIIMLGFEEVLNKLQLLIKSDRDCKLTLLFIMS